MEDLAAALVPVVDAGYHSDEDTVRVAIRRTGSFNVIRLDTSFKVDI